MELTAWVDDGATLHRGTLHIPIVCTLHGISDIVCTLLASPKGGLEKKSKQAAKTKKFQV